jgi:hypothetical protein
MARNKAFSRAGLFPNCHSSECGSTRRFAGRTGNRRAVSDNRRAAAQRLPGSSMALVEFPLNFWANVAVPTAGGGRSKLARHLP